MKARVALGLLIALAGSACGGPLPEGEGTMSFAVLPGVPEEPEDLAAELIANGCTRQLEILSSAMMVAEG